MRLLIISYSFPPANYISALRVGKWAKYLERAGIETWVLTLESGLFPSAGEIPVEIKSERVIRAGMGRCLTKYLNQRQTGVQRSRYSKQNNVSEAKFIGDVSSHTSGTNQTILKSIWSWVSSKFSNVRFPDRALPWVLPAIRAGSETLQLRSFDVILSSHGPPSSHIVASVLAKRYSIPWVADYRDLWSMNHVHPRSGLFQWFEMMFERRILQRASALVTVSEPLAQQLQSLHTKPVYIIPNGFDEEDFVSIEPVPQEKIDTLQIVYTGMIYPGKRDPSPLFKAIASLNALTTSKVPCVVVHFVGADSKIVFENARKYGVEKHVVCHPRCSNLESLQWQVNSDALLLLEWCDPAAKGVYTGKVFEYLGALRPILAIGPSGGVIDALLAETGAGRLMVEPKAIMAWLTSIYKIKQERGTTRLQSGNRLIVQYTRRHQAAKLAVVLRGAVAGVLTEDAGSRA